MTRHRDRGAADALGLVLIAPAVIGLALLVVALGRRVDARAQVRSAAEAAAQAAALERNPADAERAAASVVAAMLDDQDSCDDPRLSVRYPAPATASSTGVPTRHVEVDLACTVRDRGVEVIERGDRTESVTAVASVDYFRGSGP